MITREQYDQAVAVHKQVQDLMNAYHKQQADDFEARWERFNKHHEYFTDEDLTYAAGARCDKCKAGLAHPKNCSGFHQWTCSAVLKGIGDDKGHSAFPFAFYEIKSEGQPSAYGSTTRPSVASSPT